MHDISKLPKPVQLAFEKHEPAGGSCKLKSPIVIHHGIFSSKSTWAKPGVAIAEQTKRTVFCLDARDHGDSPHTDDFSLLSLISDSVNFCNENGIKSAIFLGHSLGGLIYSRMATLYPDLVERFILVDIHPKKQLKDEPNTGGKNLVQMYCEYLRKAVEQLQKEGITDLETAKKRLVQIMEPFMKDEKQRADYAEKLCIRDGKVEWKFNLPILEKFLSDMKDMKDIIPHYEGKCFEIFGSKSPFINKDDEESILKLLPNCSFYEVEGGEHANLHTTFYDIFVKEVVSFINA